MTFPRALLLSAFLGSSYVVNAAPVRGPFTSSCQPNLKQWGHITFDDKPLSIDDSGKIVVGGNPLNFAIATCSTQYSGYKGLKEYSKGYIVNANDPSQCVSVTHLDQENATFFFSNCRFNGAGDVWSSQSFAWNFDDNGAELKGSAWFNGENFNNETSIYSLRTQRTQPTIDGELGHLITDYAPNLTSLPQTQLKIPMQKLPVTATARSPPLNCSAPVRGRINFDKHDSCSNGTSSPLNSKWEPSSGTADKFFFEQCDYSAEGIKADGDYVYGRMRPATDAADGGFNCYFLTDGFSTGPNNEPADGAPWIEGFVLQTCSYTAEPGLDLVKYNKKDNTFNYAPFGNGSQPGNMYWYLQGEYDSEYSVPQYQWDASAVGQVYLSPDNANLTKYPPGKISFQADN